MSIEPSKPARIEFRTGDLQFMGEGEPAWLAAQLDKVLAALRDAIAQRRAEG